ncbi:polysaccharide biosynthesis protein [Salinibacterium sp. GXW1014]|uniref:polysaccharide biosynthesis protein n=1 Tax=Salinibacterium sp. GXW1014 TaxID=3377838 RepID=UPI00383B0793
MTFSGGPTSRIAAKYMLDACAWVAAVVLAQLLRYDFEFQLISWSSLAVLSALIIVAQFVAGWIFYLYRGRHPYGSFDEVLALVWTVALIAVVVGLPVLAFGLSMSIPRSTVFLAMPIALVLMCAVRYLRRLVAEKSVNHVYETERTLVYGAGYLGTALVKRMRTDPLSSFFPVGLIDDDPRKRRVQIAGVNVFGSSEQLTEIAQKTEATVLVVAIGRIDSAGLRRISDVAADAGLQVKVLPPLEDVLRGRSRLRDLRDISIDDLIGREVVDTEIESIAGYIQGRRVLVTGAGGSIGSELCRQIMQFRPAELMMLDRDETGLQSAQLSISGHGLLDTKDVVLADIRDSAALERIFAERRPQVVFHAAALKHLPMLEQYPQEAWKTNVLGTVNVLQAAMKVGVDTFVNISTDKAANPTSVLGHSKRVAEKLTAWAAETTGDRYVSVRFGNVIGSRGSMLPTFTALIEAGGPLTVTHPDATRFFMTIPEACQLVVQAGGIGRPAEVLILDMGEPVRILDVAERMIEMSGKDIEIVFTGLRPGEKLHEELIGINEGDERPIHPKITHTSIHSIAPQNLDLTDWEARCQNGDFDTRTVGVETSTSMDGSGE